MKLWQELRLDRFFAARLPASRKGTRWNQILFVLVAYRLIAPGSEWFLHREWFGKSALADLLGGESKPCSPILSIAGAISSTPASTCCSTI